MVTRKYPTIDLVKLTAQDGAVQWRAVLDKCERTQDLERLKALMYGLCAGMDDAVKQKLSSPKLEEIFTMMLRSIEVTVKRIFRKRWPCLQDNAGWAKLPSHELAKYDISKEHRNKKMRDIEFQKFLRDARF